jgi:hypothetical protein
MEAVQEKKVKENRTENRSRTVALRAQFKKIKAG